MLAAIAAIFQFLGALPKLIELLESKLGPDWSHVLPQLTASWSQWAQSQSPEEEDEAIKAMARALNRIPAPRQSAALSVPGAPPPIA